MSTGQDAGRKYTQSNNAPSENDPSTGFWQGVVRFCKGFHKKIVNNGETIRSYASLLTLVNGGISFISGAWKLGTSNAEQAKQNEGVT